MTYPLTGGKFQALTATGIAPFAKLYTYSAGTTTPLATFTTQGGTSPNANPVVCDAAGQANVWLSPVAYHLVLKTAAGVTIWDEDNYHPAGGPITDFAASGGSALFGFIQAGTGAVARTGQAKLREFKTPQDFGALANGTHDDTAAIQAAIAAVSAAGGGTVRLPPGRYKTTASIAMANGVDLIGEGMSSSVITPVNCHGITYGFLSSFGNSRISNLGLEGSSCETCIGIYQPGTLNDADELYGVSIDNVGIQNFNIAVKLRTARDVALHNNWFQSVNSGVHLLGKCLVVTLHANKIVYGAGCGTGAQFGVLCDYFNYTSGTGLVRPEAVRIVGANTIFGFSIGVSFAGVVYGVLDGCDVQATNTAVSFNAASGGVHITKNALQIAGSSGSVGIVGTAQSTVLDAFVVISGNNLDTVSVPTGTTIGILIGTMVAGNQDGIIIEDNALHGFTLYDIANYASGNNRIVSNRCFSTAVVNSILTASLPAGRPVYIDRNHCASTIGYDGADRDSGVLQLGTNVVSGSTIDFGQRGSFFTPTFSAGNFTASGSMTWTVSSGQVATYAWSITGKRMLVTVNLAGTSVGGTVSSALRIAIPAGRIAAKRMNNACFVNDNGTRSIGYLDVGVGAAFITVNLASGSNWTLSTTNTSVFGQIEFEVQ